jgi:hypothetical protein
MGAAIQSRVCFQKHTADQPEPAKKLNTSSKSTKMLVLLTSLIFIDIWSSSVRLSLSSPSSPSSSSSRNLQRDKCDG